MDYQDEEHKSFYQQKILEYSSTGRVPDCYVKPVVYLLASTPDTRRNFSNLFDLNNGTIKPENTKGGWLTETSQKVCQLAFNLFSGYTQEGRRKCSENYTPYVLFATDLAPIFVQAIKLRYPEYFRTKLKDLAPKILSR